MRHLSTEELLLQCDGELSIGRASHLRECVSCRTALAELEEIFSDVRKELRATVPEETAGARAASWRALERALYPPSRGAAFPLRWPAVYATAAALTLAVLTGYISSRQPLNTNQPIVIAEARPSSPSQSAAVNAPGEIQPRQAVRATASATVPEVQQAAPGATATIAAARSSEATVVAFAPLQAAPESRPESEPERFQLTEPAPATVSPASRVIATALPQPRTGFAARAYADIPVIGQTSPSFAALAAPVEEVSSTPSAETTAAVIEGHWVLMQAGIWTEDIQPVWTESGLRFEGSVENTSARRQLTAAIESVPGGPAIPVAVRLRSQRQTAEAEPGEQLVHLTVDRRPAGGVVRNSLLAHYGDAARRSFQSPEPSVLEAEVDRYVTDVFRGQGRLRAHAYALKSLLKTVDAHQIASLAPEAETKFRELVRFHMRAVTDSESHIYDRLSEGLPRRFWSYRASERDETAARDWQGESAELLKDVLQLDSTLTALLSSPASLVDISDSQSSCGELLYRIRSRARRIGTATGILR